MPRLFRLLARSGRKASGRVWARRLIDVDGLLGCGQRLLAAAEVGEADAEVIQAHREIGEEGVGSGLGEAPIDVDGLLGCGQRLLAAAEVGEDRRRGYSGSSRDRGGRRRVGFGRGAF